VVENYHKFARGYLSARGKLDFGEIADARDTRVYIETALTEIESKSEKRLGRTTAVLEDEFKWIGQHGIADRQSYISAERVGRQEERIDKKLRERVWDVYEGYRAARANAGKKYDWHDLASAVADELEADQTERRYRHIVIDEGQDFSPEMIRSLVKAVPADGSVTFFGDVAQQIYGHRMSWRTAGLKVSKVWNFKENYRNSAQIAALALAISRMPYFEGGPDIVEPVAPKAAGPLPTLVSCKDMAAEVSFVVDQAVRASATRSVGIIFRKRGTDRLFSRRLPKGSVKLDGNLGEWRGGPGICYGTYHSAKGLEFDTVLLPFCDAGSMPDRDAIATHGKEEAAMADGRLIYVGVTRARTGLIITHTGALTSLLPTDTQLYQRVAL
jgi:superfamily I DNA/RNA helicase